MKVAEVLPLLEQLGIEQTNKLIEKMTVEEQIELFYDLSGQPLSASTVLESGLLALSQNFLFRIRKDKYKETENDPQPWLFQSIRNLQEAPNCGPRWWWFLSAAYLWPLPLSSDQISFVKMIVWGSSGHWSEIHRNKALASLSTIMECLLEPAQSELADALFPLVKDDLMLADRFRLIMGEKNWVEGCKFFSPGKPETIELERNYLLGIVERAKSTNNVRLLLSSYEQAKAFPEILAEINSSAVACANKDFGSWCYLHLSGLVGLEQLVNEFGANATRLIEILAIAKKRFESTFFHNKSFEYMVALEKLIDLSTEPEDVYSAFWIVHKDSPLYIDQEDLSRFYTKCLLRAGRSFSSFSDWAKLFEVGFFSSGDYHSGGEESYKRDGVFGKILEKMMGLDKTPEEIELFNRFLTFRKTF